MPLEYERKEPGERSRRVPFLIVGALVGAVVLFLVLPMLWTTPKIVTVPKAPQMLPANTNPTTVPTR